MSYQTDFCILGAGLAGLSLADALGDRHFSTIVIDKNSAGSGASGTPGGLVNPATGRRAKKSWKAEQCYEAILDNLQKVQEETKESFYQNNGLLRPALLEKMARKMKKQYDKTRWPDGWCQWKNEEEIKEIHPGINCVDGGLWLPIGLTVDVGKYVKAYTRYLQNKGTHFFLNSPVQNVYRENKWHIELESHTVRAKHLVYAIGQNTTDSQYWRWLPINLIKGQVAKFVTQNGPISFEHSISSLGYMARTGEADSFVQGSTYEHDFKDIEPDGEGEDYLRKRMRRTLPQLEQRVSVEEQWAGVRTSTPNYKPILGNHPVQDNLHIFTGLGSKGLLYSKFLANHYGDYLVNSSTSLYPEIDVGRFQLEE